MTTTTAPRPRTPQPTHLLFCDIETTQTDPRHPGAAILEVGAIIVAWEPGLPELARASLLIRPDGDPGHHQHVWEAMAPVVREMHTVNGLWEDATRSDQAWATNQADAALRQWIRTHAGDGPLPLAGSGVSHLDQPWLDVHMPQVASCLTYWTLDIGHIRRALQLAGADSHVDLPSDIDAKPHRGLDDVELHLAEARRYLRLLGSLEPAPVAASVPAPPAASVPVV